MKIFSHLISTHSKDKNMILTLPVRPEIPTSESKLSPG